MLRKLVHLKKLFNRYQGNIGRGLLRNEMTVLSIFAEGGFASVICVHGAAQQAPQAHAVHVAPASQASKSSPSLSSAMPSLCGCDELRATIATCIHTQAPVPKQASTSTMLSGIWASRSRK